MMRVVRKDPDLKPHAGFRLPVCSEKMKMRSFGPVRTMHVEQQGQRVRVIERPLRSIAFGAIALYRAAISPVIHAMNGPACRFEPSCSVYARDAIAEFGIIRGGAMALWRVARCNPLGGHGYDPVPLSNSLELTPKE